MQQEIIESRKLVDELIKLGNRISDLNQLIPDENFQVDMVCIIGQHRHTFEEQGVTDHANCVSSHLVIGSFEGVT